MQPRQYATQTALGTITALGVMYFLLANDKEEVKANGK